MTRVSGADQVLILLRAQLQRLDRRRTGRAASEPSTPRPLSRLQALVEADLLSPDDLRRTLVRALLSEELGEGFANDPAFQSVVEEVFRVISASGEGKVLLDQAARQLRSEP